MSTIEQLEDGYYNYLCNEILKTIKNSNYYTCKEFEKIKSEFLINIREIIESRKELQEISNNLRNNRKIKYYDKTK